MTSNELFSIPPKTIGVRKLSDWIRVLEPADYRRMRWKNGQGWTTEIAAHPAAAGLNGEPFDWRVSLAEIETDCEFSAFPGYDRTLLLAEGAGMELSFDRGPPQRIAEKHKPLSFKGEWRTDCRLLDGPVCDLNVMTLRSKLRHRLEVIAGSQRLLHWHSGRETLLIYCFKHAFTVQGPQPITLGLQPREMLVLENHGYGVEVLPIEISSGQTKGVAAVIRFFDQQAET